MKSYTYLFKKTGEIEHNIPMDKVINQKYLNIKYETVSTSVIGFNRSKATISEEMLNYLKEKGYVMWSTESHSDDHGVIFVMNSAGNVVLTRIATDYIGYNKTEVLVLLPVIKFIENGQYIHNWPNRKVKIFETKEDLKAHKEKLENARVAKSKNYDNVIDEINKDGVEITLSTGKVRVLKVLKKTKKLECKVGDIIEGRIRLVQRDSTSNRLVTAIYGGNSYTNYITAYVNGECIKSIPPTLFADMFIENYIVENVTD